MGKYLVSKAVSITGADNNTLTVAETPDRMEIIVSIQDTGKTVRIRLNKEQFDALLAAKGDIQIEG